MESLGLTSIICTCIPFSLFIHNAASYPIFCVSGLPKGAMLTHENCLSPVLACDYIFVSICIRSSSVVAPCMFTLSQTTNCRLFQIQRVSRRQF